MFRFMYGQDYPAAVCVFDNPTAFHHDMYRLARYYEIPCLKEVAFETFKKCAYHYFEEYYFLRILRKGGYRNDKELHAFLIQRCHERIGVLCDNGYFHDVLRKDPELGIELAQSFGGSLWNYCCPKCDTIWTLDTVALSSPSFCPNCGHYEKDWSNYPEWFSQHWDSGVRKLIYSS